MRFWEYVIEHPSGVSAHGWVDDEGKRRMEEEFDSGEYLLSFAPISQAMYLLHTRQAKAVAIYGGTAL